MEYTIGLVIADDMEYMPFVQYVKQNKLIKDEIIKPLLSQLYNEDRICECVIAAKSCAVRLVAIYCGIGKVNAATAAAALILRGGASAVLNIGLSGAISGLSRCDVVAGTSFVEADFDLTPMGKKIGEKPSQQYIYNADSRLTKIFTDIDGVKTGKMGCGDFFLADESKKQLYKNIFGIDAFDMETGAIASVCHQFSVPFAALRKISDDASDDSQEQYTKLNDLAEKHLSEILIQAVSNM